MHVSMQERMHTGLHDDVVNESGVAFYNAYSRAESLYAPQFVSCCAVA